MLRTTACYFFFLIFLEFSSPKSINRNGVDVPCANLEPLKTNGSSICYPIDELQACNLDIKKYCAEKIIPPDVSRRSEPIPEVFQPRNEKSTTENPMQKFCNRRAKMTTTPAPQLEKRAYRPLMPDDPVFTIYRNRESVPLRVGHLYMIQLRGLAYSIGRYKLCLYFKEFMEPSDLGNLDSAFAIIPVEPGFKPAKPSYYMSPSFDGYYYIVLVKDYNKALTNTGYFTDGIKHGVWFSRGELPEVGPDGIDTGYAIRFVGNGAEGVDCWMDHVNTDGCGRVKNPKFPDCTQWSPNVGRIDKRNHFVFHPFLINVRISLMDVKFETDLQTLINEKVQQVAIARKQKFINRSPATITERFTQTKAVVNTVSFTSDWRIGYDVTAGIEATFGGIPGVAKKTIGLTVRYGGSYSQSNSETETNTQTIVLSQEVQIPANSSVEITGYVKGVENLKQKYKGVLKITADRGRLRVDGALAYEPATGEEIYKFVKRMSPDYQTKLKGGERGIGKNEIFLETEGIMLANFAMESYVEVITAPF